MMGLKLVFAGGGTGGHLFPALALADEFRRRDRGVNIVFVGGRGGLEEKVVPGYGYPLELLDVRGLKRRKGLEKVTSIAKAFTSTLKALSMLRSQRPDGVIGSGSYSSAPVVLAAKLLGIKTAILEQNALPGLTNRVLGKLVDRVYVSFEESIGYFPRSRTLFSGNPMRKEILSKAQAEKVKENGKKFTILVFGGSQGATAINAAFLDATEYLTDIWGHLRVIHQTGKNGFQQVKESYERKKLKVEVHEFIDFMADAYSEADLAVCRAGATSIAEILAFGIASVLIPYPFASDNHQEVNARCLAERGACVMMRQDGLTGRALADQVRRLFERPGELQALKARARSLGKPAASSVIAEDFLGALDTRKGLQATALP